MAAATRVKVFKDAELADDATEEALETGAQPQPQAEQPQPEQQPAPEQAPAEKSAEEKPHEEAVSYQRFQELNETNKKLQQELSEQREFRARLDERSRLIKEHNEAQQRQAEAAARAAQRPDQNIDPVGAELFDLRNAGNRGQGRGFSAAVRLGDCSLCGGCG